MATEKLLMERIVLAAERRGWSVDFGEGSCGKYAEFECHTPSGGDFLFDIRYENAASMVKAVREYAEKFDREEYVTDCLIAKRNGVKGIPYFRTLIDDAEEIWWMLLQLAVAVEKMADDSWYKVIDERKADEIFSMLDERGLAHPVGRFIYQADGVFVGIDNSAGKAWVEEFQTEAECLWWLSGIEETDNH